MTLRTVAPGQFALQGDLTMDSAAVMQQQLGAVLQGGSVTLDLAGVGKVDSAAIALLLDAVRQQQARGGQLHLTNVPDSISVLAHLYELAPLLGLPKDVQP
jgi:phospholipid transport system transporter-binding protein